MSQVTQGIYLVRPATNLREYAIVVESFPSYSLFEWTGSCCNRERQGTTVGLSELVCDGQRVVCQVTSLGKSAL